MKTHTRKAKPVKPTATHMLPKEPIGNPFRAKFEVGHNVILGDLAFEITKIDRFGSTAHYGFVGESVPEGAYRPHFLSGWLPVAYVDRHGKPIENYLHKFSNHLGSHSNCHNCGWERHLHEGAVAGMHSGYCPVL